MIQYYMMYGLVELKQYIRPKQKEMVIVVLIIQVTRCSLQYIGNINERFYRNILSYHE